MQSAPDHKKLVQVYVTSSQEARSGVSHLTAFIAKCFGSQSKSLWVACLKLLLHSHSTSSLTMPDAQQLTMHHVSNKFNK